MEEVNYLGDHREEIRANEWSYASGNGDGRNWGYGEESYYYHYLESTHHNYGGDGTSYEIPR